MMFNKFRNLVLFLFAFGLSFGVAHGQSYGLYQNCSLQTAQGAAVAGAQVYFLTQPGANTSNFTPQAPVFSSSTGGAVTQPLTTDGFGECSAYLSPGLYTVCYVSPYVGTRCFPDQQVLLPSGGSGSVINPITQITWPVASGPSLPTNLCPTSTTGSLTSGSATVIVSSTTGIYTGQTASGAGIPSGAFVQSVNTSASTVTLTANATNTASGVSLSFASIGQPFQDTSNNQEYFCSLSGWTTTYSGIQGSGTANFVPLWETSSTLGNSTIDQNATRNGWTTINGQTQILIPAGDSQNEAFGVQIGSTAWPNPLPSGEYRMYLGSGGSSDQSLFLESGEGVPLEVQADYDSEDVLAVFDGHYSTNWNQGVHIVETAGPYDAGNGIDFYYNTGTNWTGPGFPPNGTAFGSIAIWGEPRAIAFTASNVYLPMVSTGQSTLPICPNGDQFGALTTTGCSGGGGSMVYPGAGVANSTGTAWGTSYQVGASANDLVQLNGSAQLPAVSGALLTNLPFMSLTTTGTSGPATLSGGVLNVPEYSGGGGGGGAEIYLTCSTDLGAQINAAVSTLGTGGGIIVLPNCTSATWTTTATLPYNSDSLVGYGPYASQATCSVASGSCLIINPAIYTEADSTARGGEIAGFGIVGSGASSQTLFNAEDMIGFNVHDILLNGPSSGTQPTCAEFQDVTYWTEQNTVYNFTLGQQCGTPVLFAGFGSTGSFGYNNFSFSAAPQNTYAVQFTGNGQLYNSVFRVTVNHHGSSGGAIEMSNGFQITGTSLLVDAEEQGSGGTLFDLTSASNFVNVWGTVNNGNNGSTPLPNYSSVASGATLYVSNALGAEGADTTAYTSSLATDTDYASHAGATPRDALCPNVTSGGICQIGVGHDTATGNLAVFGTEYTGNDSSSNLGFLGLQGNIALQWKPSGSVTFPNGGVTILTGPLTLSAPGAATSISVTNNWMYGTTLNLTNTSSGGKSWNIYSGGSGNSPGTGDLVLNDNSDNTNPLILGQYGPQLPVYTVSALPSAPAGTTALVSDATSYTPGTCTGGGSDYMVAVSAGGGSWSCH